MSPYLEFRELHYFKLQLTSLFINYMNWLHSQRVYAIVQVYGLMMTDWFCEHLKLRNYDFQFNNTKAIQVAWVLAHSITIFESLSLVYYRIVFGIFEEYKYNITFISMILTYIIISYRHLICLTETKRLPPPVVLSSFVRSDNTYLLAISVLSGSSDKHLSKVIPFAVYSFLNLYTFLLEDVLQSSMVSRALMPYSGILEEKLLFVASTLELLVGFVYLKELHTDKAAITYYFILFLRFESSDSLKQAIAYYCKKIHQLGASYFSEQVMNNLDRGLVFIEGLVQGSMLQPTSNENQFKLPRPKKQERVASLNFDVLEIIDDL